MTKLSFLTKCLLVLLFTACSTDQKISSMRYLSPDEYADIKRGFDGPPAAGSAEQAADETDLLNRQASRTADDCKRANSEVLVSLAHFYGGPEDELKADELNALKPLFKEVHLEANDFIHRLKNDFPRPRPYTYIKGLKPCVTHEDSLAYPSGHATLSELDALVLGEIFPKRAEKFEKRALQIANDRVMAGVHHPTDIAAGRSLAHAIYDDMRKSPRYVADVEEIRANLKTPEAPVPVH